MTPGEAAVEMSQGLIEKVNAVLGALRKRWAADPAEEELPKFFVFCRERNFLIAAPWTNEKEKDQCAEQIRKICQDQAIAVDALIYMSESWILNVKTQAEVDQFYREKAAGMWKGVADHPAAKETMLITAETKTEGWMGTAEITGKGEARKLGEITWVHQGTNAQGRFVGLLYQPPREVH